MTGAALPTAPLPTPLRSQTLEPAAFRAAIRELLVGAVSRPSLSGEEGEVAEYLRSWMAAQGFEAHLDAAGSVVGRRGTGPLMVALLGHIDTVAGHIPVRVDQDDVLHGRGSVDAKGSFCTFVAAVAALDEKVLAQATFVCIGATEEEASSSAGARQALQDHQPDLVVIGEPSGWEGITLGYKGRLVAKIDIRKDNFHTAGDGTSAGDDLAECWLRLRDWAAQRSEGGIFGTVQATIQAMNFVNDGITQVAQASVGLRLPLHLPPTQARAEISALLGDLPGLSQSDLSQSGLSQSGLKLDFAGDETAVKHDRDSVLARALRVSIRQAGGTPVFKLKTGTSDMNVVAPHWPVPTLAYGPGDSSLDHTPEERLSLPEYERAVWILHGALERVAAKGK